MRILQAVGYTIVRPSIDNVLSLVLLIKVTSTYRANLCRVQQSKKTKMTWGDWALLFCLLRSYCNGQVPAPEVTTQLGAVSGTTHTLHNSVDVSSYLNIPFAKPPVGDLRFQVEYIKFNFAGFIGK